MRFVRLNIRKRAACTALVLPFMLAASAWAGGKPEKIEFSDPASPITFSNLNRLSPNKSYSEQIKEDLFKPLDSMKEGNSLDPVMPEFQPPRQQQVAPDRRQQELLDRKKNWAFVDPADLLPKNNPDDLLPLKQYGPDGKEKKDPTAIEKYYEKLGKRIGPTAVELSEQPGAGRNRDFAGTNAFNPSKFAYSTNETTWSIPSGENEESPPPWAANSTPTPIERLREKQHRTEFNKLLNGRIPATAASPSASASGFAAAGNAVTTFSQFGIANGPTGLSDAPGPTSFGGTAETKTITLAPPVEYHNPANPVFFGASADAQNMRPHILDDPTLRALGLPQPPVKLAETPKPAAPVMERASEFSLPQRKF